MHAPFAGADGTIAVAAGDASPENMAWLRGRYGDASIVPSGKQFVLSQIEKRFRQACARRAVSELLESEPQFSASTVITERQRIAIASSIAAATLAATLIPSGFDRIATATLTLLFAANGIFRAILLWIGARSTHLNAGSSSSNDADLPIYTILVPLYREAHVVSSLVRAVTALDYPRDRLDIKLVVEEDDEETARAAEFATAGLSVGVVHVPPGSPRTKPRACNYALSFALGEFTVIFDAEDRPEPDQLRKAVAAFRMLPDDVACLQARLNFYNATENWLTRLFALDYALWFDYLLPGLDRLDIPMPLGGTSNHFRTAALRAIHGWDPYNVTEDADLGIRLARVGKRVRVLDSTTFEEATSHIGPWLRQRSRWLKGYMQTWLVHMRSPFALLRNAGIGGFIGFQLFVAGTFLSSLLNPVLWGIFLWAQFCGSDLAIVSHAAAHASLLGLVIGNGFFIGLAIMSPARRGWLELAPYGLSAPFYWILISCAGIRALIQLCVRPWYWDKTPHGLSKKAVGQ